MPNTFTQIYIHVVFTVQGRLCLISPKWKEKLFQYITGIIRNNGHKLLAINGPADHIHILIGMKSFQALAELMKCIKKDSSLWINRHKFVPGTFSWQDGYGAFSYSHSQIDRVIKYIDNQEKHHNHQTFKEEYLELLKKFALDYDEKYLFKWITEDSTL